MWSENDKGFSKSIVKTIVKNKTEKIGNKFFWKLFLVINKNNKKLQRIQTTGDVKRKLNKTKNTIPKKLRDEIKKTPVGSVSEAIILPEGILIFKLKEIRSVENIVDLDQVKDELISNEKAKILNMYSQTHYDKLRRSITIKYY